MAENLPEFLYRRWKTDEGNTPQVMVVVASAPQRLKKFRRLNKKSDFITASIVPYR